MKVTATSTKREHKFRMGADKAECTCDWVGGSRVGRVSVAREHHKRHVNEVLAQAGF